MATSPARYAKAPRHRCCGIPDCPLTRCWNLLDETWLSIEFPIRCAIVENVVRSREADAAAEHSLLAHSAPPRRARAGRRQIRQGGDDRVTQSGGSGRRRVISGEIRSTGLDYFSDQSPARRGRP